MLWNGDGVDEYDVGIVGGGPAGLAAAFRLQRAGYRAKVFEATDHPGGRIRTARRDGFIIDEGATLIHHSFSRMLGLLADAGLTGELAPMEHTVVGLARDQEIHYVDQSRPVRELARSRVISTRAKLVAAKMALDILRVRSKLTIEGFATAEGCDDESAADYARRRLDQELIDTLIDPGMRGAAFVPAADVSKLVLFYAFAVLLGKGWMAFRNGYGAYPEMLSKQLTLELSARVRQVDETADDVTITWQDRDGSEHSEHVAGCIMAVQAPITADLLPHLDAERADFLRSLRYASAIGFHVANVVAP